MSVAQGQRWAAVRTLTGTDTTHDQDWNTLFDLEGIRDGDFNTRMLAWINWRLGTSHVNLTDAKQAFAVAQGAERWNTLTTVPAPDNRLSLDFVNERYNVHDGTRLVGYDFSTIPNSTFARAQAAYGFTKTAEGAIEVTSFAANAPRLVVDPKTGNKLGYFSGTAFTNQARQSSDWASPWNATAVDGVTSAAFGFSDALLTGEDNNASSPEATFQTISSGLPTDGQSVDYAVLVKKDIGEAIVGVGLRLIITTTGSSVLAGVGVQPETGDLADWPSAAPTYKYVKDLGDYWAVFWGITLSIAPETVTAVNVYAYPGIFDQNLNYLSNAGLGHNAVAFPQIGYDQVPPLQPVVSGASAVTVAKDDFVITGLGTSFPSSTAFHLFWQGELPRQPASGTLELLNISNGATTNRARIICDNTGLVLHVVSGGSTQAYITYDYPDSDVGPAKIAASIDTNDVWLGLNGTIRGTDTAATLPSAALTDLDVMQREAAINQPNTTVAKLIAGTGAKAQSWGTAVTA